MFDGDKRPASTILESVSLLTKEELKKQCIKVLRQYPEQVYSLSICSLY